MAKTLPLGSFLDAVAQRLTAMSDDQLRAVVMALGRSAAPRERHAFLDRLGATAPDPAGPAGTFWADVELLEEEATTGRPAWEQAGEWDHDDKWWDEECPEPHWAPRLADLMARAGDCFEGDLASTLRAYQRLFAVGWRRARPPVDGEQFVAGWVAALEPLADRPEGGEWAHRLLLEGVAALEGAPGLARLARRKGPGAGAAWRAAVDTARRDHDLKAAAAFAAEALGSLPLGPDRAAIAERLATLAVNAGDDFGALDARKEAWRSARSLDRLLYVVRAAREVDAADTIGWLAEQARRSSDAKSAAIMILAGCFDAAVNMIGRHDRAAATRFWLTGADPRLVVVPVALAAGSGAAHDDRFATTVLAELLDHVDHATAVGDFGSLSSVYDEDAPPRPDHGLTLGGLLVEHLRDLRLDARTREARITIGSRAAAEAVATIVEDKHRHRYAAYAIAHAEAVALVEGQAAGDATADTAFARYPRHTAYRAELEQARQRSPLLSDPTSHRRR